MAPKFKFSKDKIIETAFNSVRQYGWSAYTARAIAKELGSSARPIYSFFSSMEQLEEEVVKRAVALLHEYMTQTRTGDPWIDHGIGYVIFAYEEKRLFRGINDDRHIRYFKNFGDLIWNAVTDTLADYDLFKGLSAEQIKQIQVTRWLYAHGLAFQVSNPALEIWDASSIIDMMLVGSKAIYDGLMKKFGSTTFIQSKRGGPDG